MTRWQLGRDSVELGKIAVNNRFSRKNRDLAKRCQELILTIMSDENLRNTRFFGESKIISD